MNNKLEKIRLFEKEELSDEFYFQSLLEQGFSKHLFVESDIERLQYEILVFLSDKVERFNAGDSSSIRVEKAQDIMASNMFTIGLGLKSYENPEDAISAIRNEPITELYLKGRKRIDTLVAIAKTIHIKIQRQLVNTDNVFYRSTIVDGINGFFKLYYPDFSAHEIHITADYQVYNHLPKLAGIEFIHAYLKALYYENQFCLNFTPDDIHNLLCGYEKNYQELLINIYGQVLTASIGCVLARTDAHLLDISENGLTYINRLFDKKTKYEILAVLRSAARALKRIFNLTYELDTYIQRSLPYIANSIETAMREHLLDSVFYTPK